LNANYAVGIRNQLPFSEGSLGSEVEIYHHVGASHVPKLHELSPHSGAPFEDQPPDRLPVSHQYHGFGKIQQ